LSRGKSIKTLVPLLFLTFLVAVNASASCAADAGKSTVQVPSRKPLIKGRITASGIIDGLEVAGIKCVLRQDKIPSLVINDVHMGTPAYYAGVTAGDTIVKIGPTPDGFQLKFSRGGKVYEAFVRSEKSAKLLAASANDFNLLSSARSVKLSSQTAQNSDQRLLSSNTRDLTSGADKSKFNLKAGDDKLLAYNIEFIIDISSSMNHEDGTNGLSKFEWCRNQVTALADRLAPYARDVTITVFNERYQTAESCNRDAVLAIYNQVRPNGNTDLVDPLMARCRHALENYRPGSRPTLIAVITDGLPNHPRDPFAVNQALIEFTKQLSSPKQILISILQVGAEFDGADFCLDLDQNLVKEGAKYDIVDTRTFGELKNEGLTQCLIRAIERAATSK
jgi:hypothetical protein